MTTIAERISAVDSFLRTLPCTCDQMLAGDGPIRVSIVRPKCSACQAVADLPESEEIVDTERKAKEWREMVTQSKIALDQRDTAEQERGELAAEVKALREGHRMKDGDNAHYEDGWRKERDGLVAALKRSVASIENHVCHSQECEETK